MKLSIVVPVYNMASDNKLRYCLNSLINQTIDDYEIIAVDDASTDNSLEILKEYEEKYSDKFKTVHSDENLRQGGARNKGIAVAEGKWIGFVDSDDWTSPDMYKRLIEKAESTGADVVGCDYSLVDRQTMEIGKVVVNNTSDQTGILGERQYKSLVMNPGSMVIKIYLKSVIDENNLRFPEKTFYEDNGCAPIWMLHFKHFERVDESLYYYYQNTASTVHVITRERCEDRLKMGMYMLDEARKMGCLDNYRQEFEYAFSHLYYMNTLFSYMLGVKKRKLDFLKKLADGMRREFPDFQQNSYYQKEFDDEQKRMAAMNMKSPLKFMVYFRLLYFYRDKLRNKIRKIR